MSHPGSTGPGPLAHAFREQGNVGDPSLARHGITGSIGRRAESGMEVLITENLDQHAALLIR